MAWGGTSLGTRNLKSLRGRNVQVDGRAGHCSRPCRLRLDSPIGGSGSPSLSSPRTKGGRSGLAILPPAPLRLFSGTKHVAFSLYNCKTDKNAYIHPGHKNQS